MLSVNFFLHAISFPKVSQRCETYMVANPLEFLYNEYVAMVQD